MTFGMTLVESGRKNVNEEAQVLNIGSKSTNNLHTIVSAFNEYFLLLVEKKYVSDDDDDDDANGSRDDDNNHNTPIY
jgi:dihydropteroate synthase